MDNAKFNGLGIAVITPFTNKLKVDYTALKKIIEHLINGGVNYIVALGTTAEVPTLNAEEKLEIIQFFETEIDGRIPLIIGIGGNNTNVVIETLKAYDFFSFDAILSVSPYYNKPSQQAIVKHYEAIATATEKPIILYNVPGRTGTNIEAATTLKLANECDNIIGIKEASADLNQIIQIIANKPAGFLVISGDDAFTIPILAVGGNGLISVIGNAFPKDWATIVEQALSQNFDSARSVFYKYINLLEGVYREGNPTGIKYAMNQLGLCENILRMPLISASQNLQKDLNDFMKN